MCSGGVDGREDEDGMRALESALLGRVSSWDEDEEVDGVEVWR